MCGRYSLIHSAEEIAARFDVDPPVGFSPRANIAPTQTMPVVRRPDMASEQPRELAELRWGLVPFWAENVKIGARMINARSETAATKPSFRAAFRKRRCLIPCDGFYEWVEHDGKKWPLRITLDEQLGAFAGLWERWSDDDGRVVQTYTILTTEAAPILQKLHGRMPVWADETHWDSWLSDDECAEDILAAMIEAFPEQSVAYWPVSRALNRPQNDEPALVEEISEQGLPRKIR